MVEEPSYPTDNQKVAAMEISADTTTRIVESEAEKPKSQPTTPFDELLLQWCVISLGAYLGAFIRVGFLYFRGGPSPSSFTVMYAQILGCAILGAASEFQARLMGGPRLHKLLYIFIATGLCGSITTFSTWMFESNKLALQQFDSG